MANDIVNLRALGYIALATSVVLVIVALVSKLNRKGGKTTQEPPTIRWQWFTKGKRLLGAPYRGILIAEKYKPLYGDIIQLSEPFKQRVVLNSFEVIAEVLEKQSGSTSDRP
ncbi:hypothetical protein FRC11_007920, partial [Ceratobasidium sp. 423]